MPSSLVLKPTDPGQIAPARTGPDERRAGRQLDLITRDLVQRATVEVALVVVADAPEGEERIVSAAGWPSEALPAFARRALRLGSTALEPLGDDATDVAFAASAPLRLRGPASGALVVGLSGPAPPPDADVLWVVESFARFASMSIDQPDELLWSLIAAARTDALTGCESYAALLEDLAQEIERAERHAGPLTCCFVDLDRYKEVNDRFGHEHGNRVLAAVGLALREVVRVNDVVGRYGGDEFVVILPDTGLEAGQVMAERLRTVIRGVGDTDFDGLDASVGVAEWRPGMGAKVFLDDADTALASAKASGGARVVATAGAGVPR